MKGYQIYVRQFAKVTDQLTIETLVLASDKFFNTEKGAKYYVENNLQPIWEKATFVILPSIKI